jgi:hypothetical protein
MDGYYRIDSRLAVFPKALKAFFSSVENSNTKTRVAARLHRGLQKRSEIEMSLGQAATGQVAFEPSAGTGKQ